MNAWVFRHLDELQRIYRSTGTAVAPRGSDDTEVLGPFAAAAAADEEVSAPEAIPPGAILRQETDEGLDVLLMPQRPRGGGRKRSR